MKRPLPVEAGAASVADGRPVAGIATAASATTPTDAISARPARRQRTLKADTDRSADPEPRHDPRCRRAESAGRSCTRSSRYRSGPIDTAHSNRECRTATILTPSRHLLTAARTDTDRADALLLPGPTRPPGRRGRDEPPGPNPTRTHTTPPPPVGVVVTAQTTQRCARRPDTAAETARQGADFSIRFPGDPP